MRKQELHPRTAIINKKQKTQAKMLRHEALQWLVRTFPQAFDNSECIRPLKLGIMDDILAVAEKAALAGISKSKLREAVVLFTRRIDYLTCLKAREMRIDLEGKAVTQVTEEEAARAALKIKKQVENSAKMARKNLVSQSSGQAPLRSDEVKYPREHFVLSSPVEYGSSPSLQTSVRSASVVVKHKTTREYDPEAVARMKKKLGLSLKRDLIKEP